MPTMNDKKPVDKPIETKHIPLPKIDLTRYTRSAKAIADVTEQWKGISPTDLDPSIKTSRDLAKLEIEDLVGKEVTVLGIQNRKGQRGNFIVALSVVKDHDEPIIIVTGAAVIVEKLNRVAESNDFPVVGTITREKSQSSRYEYFNFVA